MGKFSRRPILETIENLLKSSDVKTRIEGQSLFFAGLVGETEISVSPSGYKTHDDLEVSEIIHITSTVNMPPVPWNEEMECRLNMTASNGAVLGGNDGKIRIMSRLSLYEGENADAIKAYMGVTFFAALIHTNAFHAALIDICKLPGSKAQPLPSCSADEVWKPIQFIRAKSLLKNSAALVNGDERCLTAEFPWLQGLPWALLQIECEEHPSLGRGLTCRLDLPLKLSDADAFSLAIRLNRMESTVADWPPLLGAWTSRPRSGRPTFVSFWPNMFARAIGVEMIATWMQARAFGTARWIQIHKNIDHCATHIPSDVGPRIIRSVAETVRIDAAWGIAEERSLTWWGHTLSQRIWADPVFVEDGDDIVRVHAESDFLRNVTDSRNVSKLLSELNSDASLSAYVWDPARRTIKLRCSAFFHSQNVDWLEGLFGWAVAMQAAEAHSLAESLAMRLGADIDTSVHPKNGPRKTPDKMLRLMECLADPRSEKIAAFTKEDFTNAFNIRPEPWVMANAHDDGLTAEFPFPGGGPPTALFTATNKSIHPRLGAGLLLLLRLPMFCSSNEADALAVKLNSAELIDKTRTHFMGGWCVDRQRNQMLFERSVMLEERPVPSFAVNEQASSTLSFCAFIPSVGRQPSVFPSLVFSMAHRARWANEFLSSQLGPRDRHSYNAQCEKHISSIENLFRRVMLQPKRKPS